MAAISAGEKHGVMDDRAASKKKEKRFKVRVREKQRSFISMYGCSHGGACISDCVLGIKACSLERCDFQPILLSPCHGDVFHVSALQHWAAISSLLESPPQLPERVLVFITLLPLLDDDFAFLTVAVRARPTLRLSPNVNSIAIRDGGGSTVDAVRARRRLDGYFVLLH